MEFLRAVAKALVHECEEKTFVFPNNRSLKFFQKYLWQEYIDVYRRPLLLPKSLTISTLFSNLAKLKQADPLDAEYILYKEYSALVRDGGGVYESFDDFLNISKIIISDFNDIDKYLIDPKQLFNNVRELKELDGDYSFLEPEQLAAVKQFWGNFLGGSARGATKESFSSFWGMMYDLYNNFRNRLLSEGMGYEGMIYRKTAEEIEENGAVSNLVFIGFNAPNKCELRLMQWSRDHGNGDFYWDCYGDMVTDRDNKASMFIVPLAKEFPSRHKIDDCGSVPEIEVIGVPSAVGQTLVAAEILKKYTGEDALKSVVVLPDETLLIPLINSIPLEYDKINVSMGYPIVATPLPEFLSSLAYLQLSSKEIDGKYCFYHTAIESLLDHKYFPSGLSETGRAIKKTISRKNRIYIPSDDRLLKGDPFLELLFDHKTGVKEILDWQYDILEELSGMVEPIHKEFFYYVSGIMEKLHRYEGDIKVSTCFKLIKQAASSITVPFQGEPLNGLQVLGSLETRCLDFENVIILSVNEGRFPSSSAVTSLIPHNLRYGFGLPTYVLQDAVAAYHFYRGIYRAKNVHLIYDSRSEGLNRGEESRFIKQLKYHYNLPVKEPVLDIGTVSVEAANEIVQVRKDDDMMETLSRMNLSASALNSYLYCPLQFYYSYLAGIREDEEVIEEVDAGIFGSIYHKTMENLYSGFEENEITVPMLQGILGEKGRIERALSDAFRYNRIERIAGENLIIKEVIRKYAEITLRTDMDNAPFYYKGAELPFYKSLSLECGRTAKFKARIDRIDKIGNILRIVDYKTGTVQAAKGEFEIEELFDRETKDNSVLFQLYLYALVASDKFPEKEIDVAIYPVTVLKHRKIDVFQVRVRDLHLFETLLRKCLNELFDISVPFSPRVDMAKKCEYCPYRIVCKR